MNQELNYYMNLSYRMEIVEDKDEGGYVLSYPDLPGCMTCSDSLDDLLELAKEEGISMNQYCLYLLAKNDAEYKKRKTLIVFLKYNGFQFHKNECDL